MNIDKKIKKSFTYQNSQSSCGLACIVSISKYYGKYVNEEQLKIYSGTNTDGSTMLGLYEAIKKIGFEANGYEADSSSLKALNSPSILHIINKNELPHFVVCYGYNDKLKHFIIGDPELGIVHYSDIELNALWKSKTLLTVTPISTICNDISIFKRKRLNFYKKLTAPDFHLLLISLIISTITSLMGFATAIFSEKLIDKVLPSKNILMLLEAVLLFFVITIIAYFLSYLKNLFIIKQAKLFNTRLISTFLEKALGLPISFFNSMKKGEIYSRMLETERIQGIIASLVNVTFIEIMTLIFSIFILMYYNISIAITAAFSIPIIAIISIHFSKIIKKQQKQLMINYADFEAFSIEYFFGIESIKNYTKENFFINKLIYKYTETQETSKFIGKISAQYDLTISILGSLFSVISLFIGGYYFIVNKLEMGELFAIITILSLTMSTTINIISMIIQIQEAIVSMERFYDIMITDEECLSSKNKRTNNSSENETNKLEFQSVSFKYPGQKTLLKNIDISVSSNEFVSVFGEVGAGKSTLLHLIQRYYQIEHGSILYNNINISNYTIKDWRLKLGIVSQETQIFTGTIAENITMFNHEKINKLSQFLSNIGLNCFLENGPLFLANVLNENGNNLSGGQKQIIGFARALFSESKVMILDEPTSSMDKANELLMINILRKIKEQKAIIMITHKPEIAKKTDKIFVLKNGIIEVVGNHQELINSDNTYSRSYKALFL